MYASQPNFGKVGKNPVDSRGYITRCGICESINHWAANCPNDKDDEKNIKATYAVNLFQSSLPPDQSLKQWEKLYVLQKNGDFGCSSADR